MTLPGPIPPTRREDVVDHYHGISVADPYRWLEDGDDPEVVAWAAAQNSFTRSTIDGLPGRARWHERLVALMQLPVVLEAARRGEHLFTVERPCGAEQFRLTRRSAVSRAEPPTTLADPGAAAADAANAIDWFAPCVDGSLVAIGTSEGGTERSTLRVISGVDGSPAGTADDEIPDTRACSVAWEPDGSGFFYTRYPEGDEYHRTVHHHRLGTPWAGDPVMWAEHPDPQAWPQVTLSQDGRWLLVEVTCGWSRTDVHVLDRADDTWITLVEGVEAPTELRFDAELRALVGITHIDAPRGRVVRIALDHEALSAGPASWETLVPERDDVIAALGVTSDGLFMVTSRAALDTVWHLDPHGATRRVVDGLGPAVAIAALVTNRHAPDAFVLVDSYGAPTATWRVPGDDDGAPEPWGDAATPPAALTGELTVTSTSYRSLDGTEVGLFLVHRADVTPSAETPSILDGYGGFAITKSPVFVAHAAAWCAAGGLWAVAGLRGGWEHGEEWHLAGNRANKQNVFDDFQAAADHLVAEGLTSRERLAIHGGSNGGLLVGATLTQRPDLCRAVWCRVPLLDMIRFPQFRIARLWMAEYGDPDIAEEFAWLHAYSPYHRVVDGTCYPATLIQTAEGDSRVDPLHARKMVARLQAASACLERSPVILSQEGRAGHGVGKPVGKRADEFADGLTFIGGQLGLHP